MTTLEIILICTTLAAIASAVVVAIVSGRRSRATSSSTATTDDFVTPQPAVTVAPSRDDRLDTLLKHNLEFGFASIESREHYRKNLLILSAQNKREELHNRLSHRDIDDDLAQLYSDFDAMFLQLYPDFLDNLNRLLPDGDKLPPLPAGSLNSELRVLSLMKLGDTDIRHIAKVLNLSVATVYNYRSKYRNRIAAANDINLEDAIRNL